MRVREVVLRLNNYNVVLQDEKRSLYTPLGANPRF
jgi:hypothetical protein